MRASPRTPATGPRASRGLRRAIIRARRLGAVRVNKRGRDFGSAGLGADLGRAARRAQRLAFACRVRYQAMFPVRPISRCCPPQMVAPAPLWPRTISGILTRAVGLSPLLERQAQSPAGSPEQRLGAHAHAGSARTRLGRSQRRSLPSSSGTSAAAVDDRRLSLGRVPTGRPHPHTSRRPLG